MVVAASQYRRPKRTQIWSNICLRLDALCPWTARLGRVRLPDWGDRPWDPHIRRVGIKSASINRHVGAMNIPSTNTRTTFCRCSKRTPGFEGLWSGYPRSSSRASLTSNMLLRGVTATGCATPYRVSGCIGLWRPKRALPRSAWRLNISQGVCATKSKVVLTPKTTRPEYTGLGLTRSGIIVAQRR